MNAHTAVDSDYRQRADRHRPDDPIALAEAIRGLAGTGLKAHDISAILGIGVDAVLQLLGNA